MTDRDPSTPVRSMERTVPDDTDALITTAEEAPLVAVDGLQLVELDYVDVGEVLQPANVVPVVVKSLAFGGSQQSHDRITVVR